MSSTQGIPDQEYWEITHYITSLAILTQRLVTNWDGSWGSLHRQLKIQLLSFWLNALGMHCAEPFTSAQPAPSLAS